ncbi:MAG: archaeal proteasome endopeptidase complex subunit alpha [Candidatus Aenigmarchaeota archaeon]|nr:archaeal proteasome endopeptidase complex subunit alpha [Candidatus Aenigmarchaeota archaeon]
MEMMPEHMGYDRTIVVFSPDGRLFQVEYAREAVKKGATALGLVFKDGIILCAQKRVSRLVKFADKIFQIDDHIGLVATGIVADARVMVDVSRVKAQQHSMVYDEKISTASISKFLADRQQLYTQHAGVRPYGVSMLIGGVNRKVELYETDPSGILTECLAKAVGRKADKINKYFEDNYKEDMDEKQALQFSIDSLKKQGKIDPEGINIVVITKGRYNKYDADKLKKQGIKL